MDLLLPMPPLVGAAVVVALGLVAGLTTTVAGVGGGLVLTLALSPLIGPHAALAVAAVPLVLGNGHRLALFRAHVDAKIVGRIAIGIVPGVVAGALLVGALSPAALQGVLVAAVALAILRELAVFRVPPGRGVLAPGGFALGFLSTSAGAGGLVAGPLVLAAGLRGEALVAVAAAIGVVVNAGRVIAYGIDGLLLPSHAPIGVVLALSIIAGNALGRTIRPRLGPKTLHRATWVVVLLAAALALAGL